MRLFKWSNSNAVYIPQLDAEHRNMFRMADELHQAVLSGAGEVRVQELLRALIACEEDHFAYEERLMRSSQYPLYAWHKQQHDGVRKNLKKFVERIGQGENEATMVMLQYLSQWLQDHIGVTDRMMAAFMRNHDRLVSKMAS